MELQNVRVHIRQACFNRLTPNDPYMGRTALEFFIDIKSFRSHYGPGVDSASNRNEYQEYFLAVKAAGA